MASNGRPRVVLQKGHNGWYAAKIVIRVAAFAFEIAGIVLVQNLYTDPDQQVDADQIAILTVPVVRLRCNMAPSKQSIQLI